MIEHAPQVGPGPAALVTLGQRTPGAEIAVTGAEEGLVDVRPRWNEAVLDDQPPRVRILDAIHTTPPPAGPYLRGPYAARICRSVSSRER